MGSAVDDWDSSSCNGCEGMSCASATTGSPKLKYLIDGVLSRIAGKISWIAIN